MAENTKTIWIPLADGYYWSQDSVGNITLIFKETREKKALGNGGKGTGEIKEFTSVVGYYTTMKAVVRAAIKDGGRRGIEAGKIKTMQEYLDYLTDAEEKITDITHGF